MQIMNRSNYGAGSDDVDYYRPSRGLVPPRSHERCVPLTANPSTSPSSRSSVRTSCPVVRPQTGNSPEDDGGQEVSRGHPRRRVGVACARCRKRKIRCSGDTGDGSQCNNCKQAGLEQGQCLFLRVGSKDVPCSPGNPPYPYVSSSANTSPFGSGFSPYSIGGASSVSSQALPNPGGGSYRMPAYPLTTRPPSFYPTPFPVSYTDEEAAAAAETYGVIPSHYVLPSNDAYGAESSSTRGGNGSAWPSMPPTHAPSQGAGAGQSQGGRHLSSTTSLFLEHDSPTSYSNTPLPYLTSTMARMPATTTTTDSSGGFLMTALSSSLPSASGDSRVLPKPQQSQSQAQAHLGSASHSSASDVLSFPPSFGLLGNGHGGSSSSGGGGTRSSIPSSLSSLMPALSSHAHSTTTSSPHAHAKNAPSHDASTSSAGTGTSLPLCASSYHASSSSCATLPSPHASAAHYAPSSSHYTTTTYDPNGGMYAFTPSSSTAEPPSYKRGGSGSGSGSGSLGSESSAGGPGESGGHGGGGEGTLVSGQTYTRLRPSVSGNAGGSGGLFGGHGQGGPHPLGMGAGLGMQRRGEVEHGRAGRKRGGGDGGVYGI